MPGGEKIQNWHMKMKEKKKMNPREVRKNLKGNES